jgi:hypothetical protein
LTRSGIGRGAEVNLAQKLALLDRPYRPGIVGYLNDYKILVVKACGEFTWQARHRRTTSSSSCAGG